MTPSFFPGVCAAVSLPTGLPDSRTSQRSIDDSSAHGLSTDDTSTTITETFMSANGNRIVDTGRSTDLFGICPCKSCKNDKPRGEEKR